MTFRPVASTQVAVTTIVALSILVALGILFLVIQHQTRDRGITHHTLLFVGCLLLFLAAGSLGFRIRSYEINSGNLIIHAGFGKKVVPLAGLKSVSLEENPFAGATKDAAMAGVWSYYGAFSSTKFGLFHAYATTTARGVMLTWPDKKVLVTPDNTSHFLQSVKQAQ
ncbi:MAG TPA: PH domain-containing protein [Verrucomicrobiae bacterium]|nr:PH domain-containing protein [Verrucomicrobiae bacterium]